MSEVRIDTDLCPGKVSLLVCAGEPDTGAIEAQQDLTPSEAMALGSRLLIGGFSAALITIGTNVALGLDKTDG